MDVKNYLGFEPNSICRLCIKLIESGKVSPIFNNDKYAKCTPLSERIHYCSSVKVIEGDGLPAYICSNCLIKLNQSFVFRNQCVLADNTLKKLIRDDNFSIDEIPKFLESDMENEAIKQEDAENKSDLELYRCNTETEYETNGSVGFDEFDNSKNGRHKCNIDKTKDGSLQKANVLHGDYQAKEEKVEENTEWLDFPETVACEQSELEDMPTASASEGSDCQFFKDALKKKKTKHKTCRKEAANDLEIFNSHRGNQSENNNEVTELIEAHAGKENRVKIKRTRKVREKKNRGVTRDVSIKQEPMDAVETFTIEPDVFGFGNETKKEQHIKKEDAEDKTAATQQKSIKKSLKEKSLGGRRGRPRKYPLVKDKPTSYTCEYCQKVYPSEGGWRYHIHTMHNENYQPFICDLCGKAFKVKKNLEGHKNNIHYHLKQHLCDICGRGFASKYALKVHKIWHNDEKNFPCDICGTKFRTRGKMNTHRSIHGGPKKFMCHVCSRDFRWKKDFEIHMRTHTGEKPFKCSHCGKAFSSLTNMKKHERNHLDKYPIARNTEVYATPLTLPVTEDRTFKTEISFTLNYDVEDVRNRHVE